MKIFLGVILLIISTFVGYIKSSKFTFRRIFFDDFNTFNNKLKNEVAFKQGTIINLLQNENDNGDFMFGIKNVFINKESLSLKSNYLSDKEIKLYNDYISKIGTLDKVSQIEYLNSIEAEISSIKKQCIADEEKYKNLYIKLGFFVGLILLILVL